VSAPEVGVGRTRMRVKMVGLMVSVLAAGVVCAGGADGYTDAELRLAFPAELAGMRYGGVHKYGRPGLGYSVRYDGPNRLKVDIYVCDNGAPSIPNGCDNEIVKAEALSLGKVQFHGHIRATIAPAKSDEAKPGR